MRVLGKLLVAMLSLAVIAVLGLIAFIALSSRLPNGQQMETLYLEDAAAFETLWQSVETGRSDVDQLVEALIGNGRYEYDPEAETLLLYTHRAGVGLGAYGTGIARLKLPPPTKYKSQDAMREAAGTVEGFLGFVPIRGNWYQFFWEVD